MKHSYFRALACSLAVAIPASCTASQPQVAPLGVVAQRRVQTDGGPSNQDLLYVSNGNDEVTVYNYSTQKLVRVLTNFTKPRGECTDAEGNVYITDYTAQQILEYAHGGAKPIEKFDDSPDSPYSCAIDPTTGKLAVANDDGSTQGNIAIWATATTPRTTYTDSELGDFIGCAYDNDGNLLVTNGYVNGGPTLFAWLPINGARLVNVDVPGPEAGWEWRDVAGIQWDGENFVLDNGETIYRVRLIHGQVYYVGSTNLYYGGGQFGFYGANAESEASVVIGPTSFEGSSAIAYWSYPAGGEPTIEITHGVDEAFAAVVSVAKK